jgi:SH3-like domain-containing protein
MKKKIYIFAPSYPFSRPLSHRFSYRFSLCKVLMPLMLAHMLMVPLVGVSIFVPENPAFAAEDGQKARLTVRGSGLPVPRFVTLKSDEVNMRAGPGVEYPVIWHFRKMGLPLRVEAEFGVWRKVVDHEGTTGWMHQSVVSLKRLVLVTDGSARIYAKPDDESRLIAVAERNALLELQSCPTQWCKVASDTLRGWVTRTSLWGLLEDEALK